MPLTFLYPKRSFCLSNQFNDRCHDSNKVFYKSSVKLCHPIEYSNLLGILRWWHVYYGLYFLWIQQFPFFGNNKIEAHPLKYHKCTFFQIQTNAIFFALLKTQAKFLQMTLHVTIHCKVIQKYLHKIIQILSECFGHGFLICWRSILNFKRHHLSYKSPLVCNKCSFVFVLQSYRYFMIS